MISNRLAFTPVGRVPLSANRPFTGLPHSRRLSGADQIQFGQTKLSPHSLLIASDEIHRQADDEETALVNYAATLLLGEKCTEETNSPTEWGTLFKDRLRAASPEEQVVLATAFSFILTYQGEHPPKPSISPERDSLTLLARLKEQVFEDVPTAQVSAEQLATLWQFAENTKAVGSDLMPMEEEPIRRSPALGLLAALGLSLLTVLGINHNPPRTRPPSAPVMVVNTDAGASPAPVKIQSRRPEHRRARRSPATPPQRVPAAEPAVQDLSNPYGSPPPIRFRFATPFQPLTDSVVQN